MEALIKVEINFCQRASRAQSVLFLQEPHSPARTESVTGRGELCRNMAAPESVCDAGGQQLLESSCIRNHCPVHKRTQTARGADRVTPRVSVRKGLSWDPA